MKKGKPDTFWPPLLSSESAITRLIFTEGFFERGLLLFGQVGLDNLELNVLDSVSNFVEHGSASQKEQGRSAWCDLGAHRVDEVIIYAIMSKVSGECTHCSANCQAEERDKEQQTEQHAPECTTECTDPCHVAELFGLRFLGSCFPGDDGSIIHRNQLLLLEAL